MAPEYDLIGFEFLLAINPLQIRHRHLSQLQVVLCLSEVAIASL